MAVMSERASRATAARSFSKVGGRLFRKYVILFAGVVCLVLTANSIVEIWMSYREQRTFLVRTQRDQAETAAVKIAQFF